MISVTPDGLGKFVGNYSYSPGVKAGPWVFVSGQVPLGEDDEMVGVGDMGAQVKQALHRVRLVLNEAGADLDDVVSTTVYLKTYDLLAPFDAAYAEVFGSHRPARAAIVAGLYRPDCLVEIAATAYIE